MGVEGESEQVQLWQAFACTLLLLAGVSITGLVCIVLRLRTYFVPHAQTPLTSAAEPLLDTSASNDEWLQVDRVCGNRAQETLAPSFESNATARTEGLSASGDGWIDIEE